MRAPHPTRADVPTEVPGTRRTSRLTLRSVGPKSGRDGGSAVATAATLAVDVEGRR